MGHLKRVRAFSGWDLVRRTVDAPATLEGRRLRAPHTSRLDRGQEMTAPLIHRQRDTSSCASSEQPSNTKEAQGQHEGPADEPPLQAIVDGHCASGGLDGISSVAIPSGVIPAGLRPH